jgi:hypothetical protein
VCTTCDQPLRLQVCAWTETIVSRLRCVWVCLWVVVHTVRRCLLTKRRELHSLHVSPACVCLQFSVCLSVSSSARAGYLHFGVNG